MSRFLIKISNIFKSFGPIKLFEDISLSINEGQIFALIGENGCGKTTLLKLLMGSITFDSGEITKIDNLKISYLPQEITWNPIDITARAYLEDNELTKLEKAMSECLNHQSELDIWEKLHEKYEKLGGYQREPLEKVLNGLKLDSSLLDIQMALLSGGQRIRIALAKAFIENPDLLLLDEPTNHLDQDMLSWLKETLLQRKGSTIIVSHDRKFINETCNNLIEIRNAKLFSYTGNYNSYLQEKELQEEKQLKNWEIQQEERAQLKQKIKALSYSRKNPSPPKDRNIMAYDRKGEKAQQSLKHNLDALKNRLDDIEENLISHPKPKSIKGLRFTSTPFVSNVAIELECVSKAFGEKKLFSNFNKTVCKRDRIIIKGPNGCGKTTLLKCIAKIIPVDSGNIRHAQNVKIAFLDQELELLPLDKTPLEYFEDKFNLSEEELRKELHKAALGGEELLHKVFSNLSVGQRKRLLLLSIILQKPNILLLDEPTNHLDLLTIEAFEKALLDFEGAILAISHDETFLNKIATQIWSLE